VNSKVVRWVVPGILLVGLAIACGCSHSRIKARIPIEVGDSGGTSWTLPGECETCLGTTCGALDAGVEPYGSCSRDPSCAAAFTSFTACFAHKSLADCEPDVQAIQRSGPSGKALLACFLHDCFIEACELARAGNAP